MCKGCTFWVGFLSVFILVFSFLNLEFSGLVIVVAATLILLNSISCFIKHSCNCGKNSCESKKENVSIARNSMIKRSNKKAIKDVTNKISTKKKLLK